MNELVKRIIVAVIAIPALLFIYYYGDIFLLTFLLVLSLACALELTKMLKNKSINIMISVVPLTAFLTFLTASYNIKYSIYLLFISLLIFSAEDIFKNRIEGSIKRISSSLMIMIYCGISLGLVYQVHSLPNGRFLLPILSILIWLTDTAAYFVGMSLGKHRGIFKVSPKKSVEGFIGGFVSAMLFALLAHFLKPEIFHLSTSLLMGLTIGTVGQFGDLFESLLKRDRNIKDSSNFIPGHGGILDRFDSFIIAIPVFYIIYSIGVISL